MGIGVLQRNRAIGCVCPQEDSEDEELAHTIREAGKLQVLESASGTWRAEGVSSSPKASGLESGGGPTFQPESEGSLCPGSWPGWGSSLSLSLCSLWAFT